jgi:hypothetical protein
LLFASRCSLSSPTARTRFRKKLTVDCEKGVCTLSQKDFDMLMDSNRRAADMILQLNDANKQCANRNKT